MPISDDRALVLAADTIAPGSTLQVENQLTGKVARFSVVWCSEKDSLGRHSVWLEMADQQTSFWEK